MISTSSISQIRPPGQYQGDSQQPVLDRGRPAASSSKQLVQAIPPGGPDTDHLKEAKEMLDALKKDIEMIRNLGVRFSVDEDTGETVIKIVDKETDDIIREIPPEQVLKLREKLDEMVGMLFDQKV